MVTYINTYIYIYTFTINEYNNILTYLLQYLYIKLKKNYNINILYYNKVAMLYKLFIIYVFIDSL